LLEDLPCHSLPKIGVAFFKAVGVALLAREPAIDDVALAVRWDQRIQSAALGVIPFAALPPIVHIAALRRGKAQTLVHAFNLSTAPAPAARGRLEAMSAVVPEPPPALDVQQVARIVQRNHANIETTSCARRARTSTASVRGLTGLATPELVITDPRCTCPIERGPRVSALRFVQRGNDGRWNLHRRPPPALVCLGRERRLFLSAKIAVYKIGGREPVPSCPMRGRWQSVAGDAIPGRLWDARTERLLA
jgi:hypothetical protein